MMRTPPPQTAQEAAEEVAAKSLATCKAAEAQLGRIDEVNQNYHTFTLILLINIVLRSKFP